jgi:hypothetical protein
VGKGWKPPASFWRLRFAVRTSTDGPKPDHSATHRAAPARNLRRIRGKIATIPRSPRSGRDAAPWCAPWYGGYVGLRRAQGRRGAGREAGYSSPRNRIGGRDAGVAGGGRSPALVAVRGLPGAIECDLDQRKGYFYRVWHCQGTVRTVSPRPLVPHSQQGCGLEAHMGNQMATVAGCLRGCYAGSSGLRLRSIDRQ